MYVSVDKIIPARNSAAGHAMHRRRPSRLQIFFRFSRPHVKPTTDVITTNLPPPLPLPPFPRARATSYRFSRTVLAITTHTQRRVSITNVFFASWKIFLVFVSTVKEAPRNGAERNAQATRGGRRRKRNIDRKREKEKEREREGKKEANRNIRRR